MIQSQDMCHIKVILREYFGAMFYFSGLESKAVQNLGNVSGMTVVCIMAKKILLEGFLLDYINVKFVACIMFSI